MFAALRRCPTTLSRNSSVATLGHRTLRLPIAQSSSALKIPAWHLAKSSLAAFHSSRSWQQIAAAESATETEEPSSQDKPVTEFADLATRGLVHPSIINTITKHMRLTSMTDVQTRTINEALSGVDVYVERPSKINRTILTYLELHKQRLVPVKPSASSFLSSNESSRRILSSARKFVVTRELVPTISRLSLSPLLENWPSKSLLKHRRSCQELVLWCRLLLGGHRRI